MFNSFSPTSINALPRFNSGKMDVDWKAMSGNGPMAIYIHIPYCVSLCGFCMLRRGAIVSNKVSEDYLQALASEMELLTRHYEINAVDALYIGGGTASVMSPGQTERLLKTIRQYFKTSKDFEITFEGEAQTLKNIDLLKVLCQYGVKRISFGIQSMDMPTRNLLGRTDSLEDIYELVNKLHQFPFSDINVDYMYNLPGTNIDFIMGDLEKIKKLDVFSLDCHPLKYVSCSMALLQKIQAADLAVPSADLRIQMYSAIKVWMHNNGFLQQFADQYSKDIQDTSNVYMQYLYGLRGGQYIGFGAGSRSHFSDYGFSSLRKIDDYIKTVQQKELPYEKIIKAPHADNFITTFPKRGGRLLIADVKRSGHFDYFMEKLNHFEHAGYLIAGKDYWEVTVEGFNWYQNLMEGLLSPPQRDNHLKVAEKRREKLLKFGAYFLQTKSND